MLILKYHFGFLTISLKFAAQYIAFDGFKVAVAHG
jgi:hypothetical protein